jgi:hypothetical protein
LEKFTWLLEEYPGFSPMLTGENALVCGFHAGGSFFYLEEKEWLIVTQPRFDAQEAAMLFSALPEMSNHRVP